MSEKKSNNARSRDDTHLRKLVSEAREQMQAEGIEELPLDWEAIAREEQAGDLLKIVRGSAQKLASLVGGTDWQLLPEYVLGAEEGEQSGVSEGGVLKLTSGSLRGAEAEYTSADRLVIALNRPVPEGSQLKLVTESGDELDLPVVRPLDSQGRAIYDLSNISESLAFRLVLVEGED